jgi:hypothetical protein
LLNCLLHAPVKEVAKFIDEERNFGQLNKKQKISNAFISKEDKIDILKAKFVWASSRSNRSTCKLSVDSFAEIKSLSSVDSEECIGGEKIV